MLNTESGLASKIFVMSQIVLSLKTRFGDLSLRGVFKSLEYVEKLSELLLRHQGSWLVFSNQNRTAVFAFLCNVWGLILLASITVLKS